MLPLFVYGSLRDAELLGAVIGRSIAPAEQVAAAAPGCRAVHYPGRSYPALVEAPGEAAPGVLLVGLGAADREALDAFEGDEYRRRVIDIAAGGHRLEAEAYWPAIAIAPDARPWRIEDWRQSGRASFLVEARAFGLAYRSGLAPRREAGGKA